MIFPFVTATADPRMNTKLLWVFGWNHIKWRRITSLQHLIHECTLTKKKTLYPSSYPQPPPLPGLWQPQSILCIYELGFLILYIHLDISKIPHTREIISIDKLSFCDFQRCPFFFSQ